MQEDLRDFLRHLKDNDRLMEIDGTLSREEISHLIFKHKKAPEAFYVKKVEGFEHAFCFNLLSNRNSFYEVLQSGADAFLASYLRCLEHLIEPEVTPYGPIHENVLTGSEARLSRLPILKYNSGDAGPYITSGIVLAKDPETGIRNASIHRMQVQGERQLGIRLEPGCHLERIRRKAENAGIRLDLVIVVGNHPAELMAAVSSPPFGIDELGIAGAIRKKPLQLVKCIVADAEVPACSEIAIEGYMDPHETAIEGPFGDFMESYVPPCENRVIHIKAITYRNGPVFQGIRAGSREDGLLLALSREAAVFDALRKEGIQVVNVNLSPIPFVGVIALNANDTKEVRRALEIAVTCVPWLKYCVAVNSDVNPFDWEDVLWAVGTRSAPRSAMILEGQDGYSRDLLNLHHSKMAIDATVPVNAEALFRRAAP